MTIVIAFFLVFAAGPVLFWFLARRTPSKKNVIFLFVLVAVLIAAAVLVRGGVNSQSEIYRSLVGLVLLWAAWIVVLSLCCLAAKLTITNKSLAKVALASGAMATTLPWFGLYTAQLVAQQ